MSLYKVYFQKSASIQPRTSLPKFLKKLIKESQGVLNGSFGGHITWDLFLADSCAVYDMCRSPRSTSASVPTCSVCRSPAAEFSKHVPFFRSRHFWSHDEFNALMRVSRKRLSIRSDQTARAFQNCILVIFSTSFFCKKMWTEGPSSWILILI